MIDYNNNLLATHMVTRQRQDKQYNLKMFFDEN